MISWERGAVLKGFSMSRLPTLAALAVGFSLLNFVAAPTASASIIITNVQVPYAESVTLTSTALSPTGMFGGVGGTLGVGIAGQIVLTTQPGNTPLYVWCVDLFHNIYLGGSYTYTASAFTTDNTPGPDAGSPPSGPNALSAYQISSISKLAAYGNFEMSVAPSADLSAAIQVAIWDIEYNATATGTAGMMADLAFLTNPVFLAGLNDPGGFQIAGYNDQGLLVVQGLYDSDPVPEPSTLALIAVGILSLFGLRVMHGSLR